MQSTAISLKLRGGGFPLNPAKWFQKTTVRILEIKMLPTMTSPGDVITGVLVYASMLLRSTCISTRNSNPSQIMHCSLLSAP
jgi:hypothetical protein